MRFVLISLICLFYFQAWASITTVYKAKGGSRAEFYQTYTTVQNPDGGFTITLKFTEKGQLDREHIVTLDSHYSTQIWKFHSPVTKLSIDAYRKGDKIFLTGTKNGKKTEKQFEVGDKPWFQIFPTGLGPFALSPTDSKIFWSIGVEGPGEMEIGEFVSKHIGTESLALDSKKEEAAVLSLTFNNWKSTFWKGKSWHRKSDGRILAIQVGRDIGTWELQSEKENK